MVLTPVYCPTLVFFLAFVASGLVFSALFGFSPTATFPISSKACFMTLVNCPFAVALFLLLALASSH